MEESISNLIGPSESSSSLNPWSRKLSDAQKSIKIKNGKKLVVDHSSDESMDKEFDVPIVRTPRVRSSQRYIPPHARRQEDDVHETQEVRRSTRVKHLVERLTYNGYMRMHYAYMTQMLQHDEPVTFQEACEVKEWQEAMDEEMNALVKNETWDLVKLPSTKNVIGCKWVYKMKYNSDGLVERYKARLVAKGYAQKYGLDYEEVFNRIAAKMMIVRIVTAISTYKDWKVW